MKPSTALLGTHKFASCLDSVLRIDRALILSNNLSCYWILSWNNAGKNVSFLLMIIFGRSIALWIFRLQSLKENDLKDSKYWFLATLFLLPQGKKNEKSLIHNLMFSLCFFCVSWSSILVIFSPGKQWPKCLNKEHLQNNYNF